MDAEARGRDSADNSTPIDHYPIEPFIRQHWVELLTLMPLAAAVIACIRISAVANGDRAAFLYLVRSLDIQTVLFSVLMTPALTIIFIICVARLWTYCFADRRTIWGFPAFPAGAGDAKPQDFPLFITAFIFMISIGLYALPVSLAGFGLITGGMLGWLSNLSSPSRTVAAVTAAIYIPIILVACAVLAGYIWLPAEAARLGNDATRVTIYVLEQKEGHVTFIDAKGHIKTLPLTDVRDRAACNPYIPVSWIYKPLAYYVPTSKFLGAINHQPSCPDDTPFHRAAA
ncbi:hypothetical protein [Micromonospora sp. RP3T]|uniref:hypothetical protein n=1 Tax=Micromonospora sp. RP3T TaxID=2135446 RepID=UPI0011B22D82|nr:hypothetical protein [Micromonospora sp. RP3T]